MFNQLKSEFLKLKYSKLFIAVPLLLFAGLILYGSFSLSAGGRAFRRTHATPRYGAAPRRRARAALDGLRPLRIRPADDPRELLRHHRPRDAPPPDRHPREPRHAGDEAGRRLHRRLPLRTAHGRPSAAAAHRPAAAGCDNEQ